MLEPPSRYQREISNGQTDREIESITGSEFGERHLLGDIIEHDFDPHPAADFAVRDSEQIRDKSGPFVKFNFHHVVGNVAFVTAEVGLMKHHP